MENAKPAAGKVVSMQQHQEMQLSERNKLVRGLILKSGSDDQVRLVLAICDRYNLDPMLKHVVLISGNVYVTRDGLLHVAHSSGQLDGIVIDELKEVADADGKVIRAQAKVSVYRKDMRHPFTYWGKATLQDVANKEYVSEMAVKRAEVKALRRAFDVSLESANEHGDRDKAFGSYIEDRTKTAIDYLQGSLNLSQLQYRYNQMLSKDGVLAEVLEEAFDRLSKQLSSVIVEVESAPEPNGDVIDAETGELLASDDPEKDAAIREAKAANTSEPPIEA